MRNTKIILGAATFVLGIVGAVSTMAHNKFVKNARVWTANKVTCTLFTTLCGNSSGICTTGTALHRTVFTFNSTSCLKIHPRV